MVIHLILLVIIFIEIVITSVAYDFCVIVHRVAGSAAAAKAAIIAINIAADVGVICVAAVLVIAILIAGI